VPRAAVPIVQYDDATVDVIDRNLARMEPDRDGPYESARHGVQAGDAACAPIFDIARVQHVGTAARLRDSPFGKK
jgi:hypothetical protein